MAKPRTQRSVVLARDPNPTRKLERDPEGRQHQLADDLVKQFGLDKPGTAQALMEIRRMREWGVTITPDIARKCLAYHLEFWGGYFDRQGERLDSMRHASVVYYMRLGNRVKIGYSSNLEKRMESIRPEELLATEPGDREIEQARHRQFADLRTHGEWFRHEPPLSEFIDALREAQANQE